MAEIIKIKQVNTRIDSDGSAIDVTFSNGYCATLFLTVGSCIATTIGEIDDFRVTVGKITNKAKQAKIDQELFNEFMQLATMSESTHGAYILQNARMLEIAKLIPDKFQQFPEDIRIGTAVHLRGAPY